MLLARQKDSDDFLMKGSVENLQFDHETLQLCYIWFYCGLIPDVKCFEKYYGEKRQRTKKWCLSIKII